MAKARRVRAKVLYDHEEIGLSDRLTALSYTDNAEGKSDEVTLTFEDRDARWLMERDKLPEKGHDLDVTLRFEDWNYSGNLQKYHVGRFTIDDISFSGPVYVCTVKGVSIPADEGFNSVPQTQTWSNVTLKQLAYEFMEKYGMTELYWYGDEPVLEAVEQSNQTDSTFLYDLCKKQGMFLKVYKTGLVIFDKKIYEPRPAKETFRMSDVEKWDWNATLNGTYTGANLKYTSSGGKNKDPKTIDVTVGAGPRLMYINQHVSDEAEAERIAKAKVNEANEKAVTIRLTTMPKVILYATDNFQFEDGGICSGKYFTSSVTHSLSGGKYSMQVTGYKVFDRL